MRKEKTREALVAEAGEALWYLTIQRDLMGFRNRAAFLKELGVPKEVVLRMGVRVAKPAAAPAEEPGPR